MVIRFLFSLLKSYIVFKRYDLVFQTKLSPTKTDLRSFATKYDQIVYHVNKAIDAVQFLYHFNLWLWAIIKANEHAYFATLY